MPFCFLPRHRHERFRPILVETQAKPRIVPGEEAPLAAEMDLLERLLDAQVRRGERRHPTPEILDQAAEAVEILPVVLRHTVVLRAHSQPRSLRLLRDVARQAWRMIAGLPHFNTRAT